MSQFKRIAIPLDSAQDLMKFVIRGLRDMVNNLGAIFDKGVGVLDNLDVATVGFISNGTPDTEDAISHTLKRIPVGFIVINQDMAASVYASGTAFTKTTIYLKTNVASAAINLVLF